MLLLYWTVLFQGNKEIRLDLYISKSAFTIKKMNDSIIHVTYDSPIYLITNLTVIYIRK